MTYKYRCLFFLAPGIFLLDQGTKALIQHYVPFGTYYTVIHGFFDIVHVTNAGGAFGMLAGARESWREPFFYCVSVVAFVVVISIFLRLGAKERLMPVTMGLILGGMFGNLIDRFRFGAVTDFLSLHWQEQVLDWNVFGWQAHIPLSWPSFNVADSAITVSMVLLAWHVIRSPKS